MNQSSADIGNLMDAKEHELSNLLKNYYTVEQEKLTLQRSILELQIKKKDLEVALSKASHLVRQANIEYKLLKSQFFQAKNSGI